MTKEEIRQKAQACKQRASQILHKAFKIPDEFHANELDELVDLIVSAAILEMTSVQLEALNDHKRIDNIQASKSS